MKKLALQDIHTVTIMFKDIHSVVSLYCHLNVLQLINYVNCYKSMKKDKKITVILKGIM